MLVYSEQWKRFLTRPTILDQHSRSSSWNEVFWDIRGRWLQATRDEWLEREWRGRCSWGKSSFRMVNVSAFYFGMVNVYAFSWCFILSLGIDWYCESVFIEFWWYFVSWLRRTIYSNGDVFVVNWFMKLWVCEAVHLFNKWRSLVASWKETILKRLGVLLTIAPITIGKYCRQSRAGTVYLLIETLVFRYLRYTSGTIAGYMRYD